MTAQLTAARCESCNRSAARAITTLKVDGIITTRKALCWQCSDSLVTTAARAASHSAHAHGHQEHAEITVNPIY